MISIESLVKNYNDAIDIFVDNLSVFDFNITVE